MTNPIPGAIINVRRGQYEDASGMLHTGWLHDHVCLYPGCGGLVECEAQPFLSDDADGMPRSGWSCDQVDMDPLCHRHADEMPCDYCGEYGHDEDHCPEAVSTEASMETWDKTDWIEHAAEAVNQEAKDGR